jgi:hypothetical protein
VRLGVAAANEGVRRDRPAATELSIALRQHCTLIETAGLQDAPGRVAPKFLLTPIAQNRPSHPMGRGSRSRLSLRMRLRWANNPIVAYRRSSPASCRITVTARYVARPRICFDADRPFVTRESN